MPWRRVKPHVNISLRESKHRYYLRNTGKLTPVEYVSVEEALEDMGDI